MERRFFLKSLLGLAGAAVVGVAAGSQAEAMPVDHPTIAPEVKPDAAVATPEDVEAAKTQSVQYYWRRRRVVRRYYYRPRYYRPRYVVRRRYYRRRYW